MGDGAQSALAPAGRDAERMADLFWWMAGGTAVVWAIVVGLAVYATYFARRPHAVRTGRILIVGGGVVFPTVVLAGLLMYGLSMMPPVLAAAPEGSLRIHVVGEQWWWRVRYLPAAGEAVELANEIRLPVGEPVEFHLESADVIHSFWIPALGGKMDMIPGRRTRLTLRPTRTGTFRGVCAEYCGTSHAFMAFPVVVMDKEAFAGWLARQAQPAAAGAGQAIFMASGCGACHTIRGTAADGVVGPDLTHVGSRLSLGAGRLGADVDSFRRWIADPDHLKPKVLMPAFRVLGSDRVRTLSVYLEGLQ